MELTTYRASDRRVYNGAYCSDMERERDHTKQLMEELLKLEPNAICTYFPMEGKWDVSRRTDYKSIIPDMVEGKQEAIIEAIELLRKESK